MKISVRRTALTLAIATIGLVILCGCEQKGDTSAPSAPSVDVNKYQSGPGGGAPGAPGAPK